MPSAGFLTEPFLLALVRVGMIAYGIIVGQTLPKLFDSMLGHSFLSDRRAVIILMTFTVMLPLSCNKVIGNVWVRPLCTYALFAFLLGRRTSINNEFVG